MRCVIPVLVVAQLSACGLGTTKQEREESANIQRQLGIRYLDMNRLSIAQGHLEKAHAMEPDNVETLNALAFLSEKLEQPAQATAYYQHALRLEPDNLGVLNNYGRYLCNNGEFDKGMSYLEQAISSPLNNRKWLALTNAGRCQLGRGLTDSAEAFFREALQIQAFYAPALLAMQKISYQKADYWGAKGFLGRYLSVGKHTPETLWYAYQTERALGNQGSAEEYRSMLLEKFPLSEQAKQINAAQKNLKNGE